MRNQGSDIHGGKPSRRRTIAVTEDDRFVRRFIGTVLSEAGFHIIAASNVAQARVLIKAHGGPLALAICDIRMPGESGLDLAVSLEVSSPAFPVLFISGLVESIAVQSILLRNPFAILTKPFTGEALVERVHMLIGSAASPAPIPGSSVGRASIGSMAALIKRPGREDRARERFRDGDVAV